MASPPVSAATWRVELDGSGDYDSTWDAVWGADAGDTILIGAGRFDTVHHYESHDGAEWDGSVDTHMLLHSRDLTVIGQGPGVTVLGNSGLPNIFGIAVVFDYHTDWDAIVRIENLSIESTDTGIAVFYNEPIIHVANVEFLSCLWGIRAISSESSATDCFASGITNVAFTGVGTVSGCEVNGALVGVDTYGNSHIESTVFRNCKTAIDYSGTTLGPPNDLECTIVNCDLTDSIEFGISADHLAICIVSGNSITATAACIAGEGDIVVTGANNVLTSDGGYILFSRFGARFDMQGNDFIHSRSVNAVGVYQYNDLPAIVHDLTGNWWGDYTEDDLPLHIHDGNQSSSVNSFVEFLPMAGGSVPTKGMSWGSLKASFR